jgi:Fic family protein
MMWNWQQLNWPRFSYDQDTFKTLEEEFLYQSGYMKGSIKHLTEKDHLVLTVDLISQEALKTSEIEGDTLNRESIQSSIRRHFGLETNHRKISLPEQGISEMLIDSYTTFADQLTHQKLFDWHTCLTKGRRDLLDVGTYRTHPEPMQVVSSSVDRPKVYFEAPPSKNVLQEMNLFIQWFNQTAPTDKTTALSPLIRAGIAHLYFVSIHPFEDGNGRIGRAIAEKVLFQSVDGPILTSLSSIIQKNKKKYYHALENANQTLEITDWLLYFSNTILEAQRYTQTLIEFIIKKTKILDKLRGQCNLRQEKVILRLLREGPQGFKGGLSADNYITISQTSRATATRDLQMLVAKGVLQKTGQLKGTRYSLNMNFA